MKQLANNYTIRFTDVQISTLNKLKDYDINISQFIRIAIAEKIKRDYRKIKEPKEKYFCPF